MTEPRWMDIARGELGVKEAPGAADNPRVVEYHAATSLHSADDETPWCSAFANWCMAQAGLEGTNSAAARSWLKWGEACEPKLGAVTVLWRGKPTAATGHVGFFVKADASFVWLLGGNQGDAVSIQPFPRHRVLAYRWPALIAKE
jgi:uncharacterized protein (TIGR02594 family)